MATGPKRAAIYQRTSTTGQQIGNQSLELERVAERRGWTVVEIYEDVGVSGAKGPKPDSRQPHHVSLCLSDRRIPTARGGRWGAIQGQRILGRVAGRRIARADTVLGIRGWAPQRSEISLPHDGVLLPRRVCRICGIM
jgi:hypothetical protein